MLIYTEARQDLHTEGEREGCRGEKQWEGQQRKPLWDGKHGISVQTLGVIESFR